MLAHHPVTGQPIRILRTEVQLAVDQKTLVWVRSAFQASARWRRWFPIVSEVDAVSVCGAESLCAVVLGADSDIDAWFSALTAISAKNDQCLLVAPSAVVDALEKRGFSNDSTLRWEEMYDGYPYLGEPLKATDPVEKAILSLAHVLRMNRVVWSSSVDRETMDFGTKAQLDAWARTCSGVLSNVAADSDDSCIPKVWLIQQYFKHPSNRRAREITACLDKNIECPYIDHILLLNETEFTDLPPSPKIRSIVMGHRLTYKDTLLAAQTHVPAGDYVLFANADIYCNETLQHLWRIRLKESRLFLALLRWECDTAVPHIFGPRADSQDAWIVARDCLDFEVTEAELGFPFGKSGCDNALALIMMRHKFLVANPAYTIQTFHLHSSNIRNYDPKDVLYRPHYLYLDPTVIQGCALVKALNDKLAPVAVRKAWSSQYLGKSFVRPILSVNDVGARTVCTMLRQKPEDSWTFGATESNMYTPTHVDTPLYNFKGGVFVTAEGLVSSFTEIFVGPHPLWKTRWEAAQHSSLTSSIHVPHMIAVPFDVKQGKSLNSWALYYLPRVLAIRDTVRAAGLEVPEFLVPQIPDIGALLTDLQWNDVKGNITVIPMMTDVNYYSEDVWAVPPTEESHIVTAEDIKRLRALLPERKSAEGKPVMVFCVDDASTAVCTREWADSVATNILSAGWAVRYVAASDMPADRRKAFSEASWIVGSGSALDWMWYAAPETTVMEFMSDSEPVGEHIHLAGAAGLRYVLGVIKKEPIEYQRQNAMLDVGKAVKKHGFKEMLASVRRKTMEMPRIVVPTGMTGIMAHAGDTFREMVDIWKERGYVTVERSDSSGYCWWGGVGEILLYDRPTHRWWNEHTSYQMALFGNCSPPGPGPQRLRQSVWGFWPRSPRAVEQMASRFENLRKYDARSIKSLFLGKVENGVQKEHRTGADWSTAVDLFSMPIDSTGAPYPYSQEQYLDKLCSARFGLCLPGFGPKCNREIEYFACGCVPIVTPGVDMKGYLVPPQEGIHYFTASTPEEVRALVKNTPPERWLLMSSAGRSWWRTYASAEGLFRLTWARIEQCRPYFNVGIPSQFLD